jgi:hypothetical protein
MTTLDNRPQLSPLGILLVLCEISPQWFVIPAQAGIQILDARFRRYDTTNNLFYRALELGLH